MDDKSRTGQNHTHRTLGDQPAQGRLGRSGRPAGNPVAWAAAFIGKCHHPDGLTPDNEWQIVCRP